jgi:hypothetical protein
MQIVNRTQALRLLGLAVLAVAVSSVAAAQTAHTSSMFAGPKANTGTAVHAVNGSGQSILRVSQDFKVPDTPAPTWRVVDSQGNIYTLDAFKIKGGEKREIVVPAYIRDIAKVQVYCAWAEVLLGESSFSMPVASAR